MKPQTIVAGTAIFIAAVFVVLRIVEFFFFSPQVLRHSALLPIMLLIFSIAYIRATRAGEW
jgi:predicted PurR-regulated permease PerM